MNTVMPAVEERKLTRQEFHTRYGGEKPYFEYWDGEAVQKSTPTRLHSLIETVLEYLLKALGYEAGHEIGLRLDPDYQPIPDVIAGDSIGDPYPTEAFEVAIEVLSPEDPFARVLLKCRLYQRWGIRQIVVIDPIVRQIWTFDTGSLRETQTVAKRGERSVTADDLWTAVDRELRVTPKPPA